MAGEVTARMISRNGTGKALPELTAASDLVIPPDGTAFTLTGTTGIDTINATGPVFPGRQITLLGTDATGPALTDTAIASTAQGKIHLSAALTLILGATVTFTCANNGSWWESGRGVNG